MITTSHGIIGYLLFEKRGREIWKYSVLGAMIPDFPMIISSMFFYFSYFILGKKEISHESLHDGYINQFLSPIMHSIFLWLFILGVILIFRNKLTRIKLGVFAIGGISHIVVDFLTHRGEWTWNHLYSFKFDPIEGLFYYLNPYFIVIINIIWGILLGPNIYIP